MPTPTITMDNGLYDAATILSTVFCISVITPSYVITLTINPYVLIIFSTCVITPFTPQIKGAATATFTMWPSWRPAQATSEASDCNRHGKHFDILVIKNVGLR